MAKAQRVWVIYITMHVLNDGLEDKSSNLSEQFRLTALVSQSVEQFCLARKTNFQIFTTYCMVI
jgi:hypothetical protein